MTLPATQTLPIAKRTIAWREAGQGPALVLLHGIGGASASWEYQFTHFAEHYRVIVWDMPGYGASQALKGAAPTVDDYLAVLVALLDALGGLPLAIELTSSFLNQRKDLDPLRLLAEMRKAGEMETLRVFASRYGDELPSKHELDVNAAERHISIFGGKLTDCLNVGEDVCQQVEQLGVSLANSQPRWYGEPPEVVRDEFLAQARGLKLDKLAVSYASEPLSQRLWRRYGTDALAMLEEIREDPHMGEVLIEDSEYLRVEIAHAARRELIVRLEDFLRRRSKIALLVPFEQLRQSQGLREACRVLFDSEADARWDEYFQKNSSET